MKLHSLFLIFCITLVGSTVSAKTYADLSAIVTDTAKLVRTQFVDEKLAHKSADELLNRLHSGAYSDIGNISVLVKRITSDLQTLTGDKHIGIVHDAKSVARYRARAEALSSDKAKAKDDASKKQRAEEARLHNYGLRSVEMMQGGVGYLRIDYFDGHITDSLPVIAGVMDLLASSEAIILDLRHNGGGNMRFLPVFLGYFLGPDSVHLGDLIERWKGTVLPVHTIIGVPGARHFDKPLYILTSSSTFSLAEAVVYNLKAFDRATVIGERTGGGGSGFDPVVLNNELYLRMPRMKFVNAKTGTYFKEGVGISPDIKVIAKDAKRRAYLEALNKLYSTSTNKEQRNKIEWAQHVALGRIKMTATKVSNRSSHPEGQFGRFKFEPREDGLWLSDNSHSFVKLEQLSEELYLDDRTHQRQFHFEAISSAKSTSVTVKYYGNKSENVKRKTE